ncbi:hypothetical protein DS745_08830 [Anaerobacillus alkaliphilus]|uniref:GerMN domain-containing protein n=1 Tax=Anaerobacillus alkaliphilus TaxID=1548597 RepID=A0A4Q0VV83_9BACI|nr:hypothetical protein [Anaerobacillus alkaliphilus]RXJ01929.1 hypothetical protein DS745_08830 [Anaerobacillus alkaliphilus]
MKRSSNWDEKTIENQLRKLPKIEDKQSKEALFERIQERLQEDQIKERKTKKHWIVPSIAAAAVFFLLLLIVPSFLSERNVSIEDSQPEFRMEVAEEAGDVEVDMNGIASIDAPGITSVDEYYTIYFGAVQPYEEEFYQDQLVKLAVPVSGPAGEFVVQVTLLAEGANEIERFLAVKENFSGEPWGIGNFPSIEINSIFEGKGGVLIIDVPTGSLESLSTAENFAYSQSIIETFWPRFREVELSSDGEPNVFWGQSGPISGFSLEVENRGYYLFESPTGHLFLVTGKSIGAKGNDSSEDVSLQETLEYMKQYESVGNMGYLPPIGDEFIITNVEQNDEVVTITFADGTIFENSPRHQAMVEAILFTARDFGHSYVQFEGIQPTQVGPYFTGDLLEIPRYFNFIR